MVRILYHLAADQHSRVYRNLYERADIVQALVMPAKIKHTGFKIKTIYRYNKASEVKNILDKFKPDVFMQSSLSRDFEPMIKKRGIKFGLVTHGVVPKSVECRAIADSDFFRKFDFFCAATRMFKEIVEETNNDTKVYTNILTQSDILYKKILNRDKIRKDLIRKSKNPKADKLIVLFGHVCSEKHDKLLPYHYGYYKAIVELDKMARKNNWAIYVKPKSDDDTNFIKRTGKSWAKLNNIRNDYLAAIKNNSMVFLRDTVDPYDLYCSDIIICSARTTVETESSMANVPLIRLWVPSQKVTEAQLSYEYGAIDANAAYIVKDMNNLNKAITSLFGDNSELYKKQKVYTGGLGLTFDGKSSLRLVDAIIDFCKEISC